MTDIQKLKYDLAMNCALVKALSREDADCCRGISNPGTANEEQLKEALEHLRAE